MPGEETLNPKQELFCKLFASDREFFGNGVMAYAEAYDIDLKKHYNTAKVNASQLLTKTNILNRINEIFESRGLNDQFVDKQLEKLITQDADFKTKVSAIKEYNQLKKRISNKVELTGKDGEDINMSITYMPEQLPDDFFKNSTDNNS